MKMDTNITRVRYMSKFEKGPINAPHTAVTLENTVSSKRESNVRRCYLQSNGFYGSNNLVNTTVNRADIAFRAIIHKPSTIVAVETISIVGTREVTVGGACTLTFLVPTSSS
jgi:hypothetical protein